MDFFDLPAALRGKQGETLQVRFEPDDVRETCRYLTQHQARGDGKVTPRVLGRLIIDADPDTIEYSLLTGLRHSWKKVDIVDVQRMIRAAIAAKELDYEDLRLPLLRAWRLAGLAEFEVYIKIVEDAERDSGKATTPATSSRTTSSRTSFEPAESGS